MPSHSEDRMSKPGRMMEEFNAVVDTSTGIVIAMSGAFSGETFRHFHGGFAPGDIAKGLPWSPFDHSQGYTERSHSRIVAVATREDMKPIVAGIIAECDRKKKKRPRFASGGTWYRVLED